MSLVPVGSVLKPPIRATPETDTPKSYASDFEDFLSQFRKIRITESVCIENCVNSAVACLPPLGNLSEEIREIVGDFGKAAEKFSSFLTPEETLDFKNGFKKSLCRAIQDKWVARTAQSFDDVLLISDRKGKIAAAQKWTEHFLSGVGPLKRWNFPCSIFAEFVKELSLKTLTAFEKHSDEARKKKAETMIVMKEKFSLSLSAPERDLPMSEVKTSSVIEIDQQKKLLKLCMEQAFKIKQSSSPSKIIGEESFAKIFA